MPFVSPSLLLVVWQSWPRSTPSASFELSSSLWVQVSVEATAWPLTGVQAHAAQQWSIKESGIPRFIPGLRRMLPATVVLCSAKRSPQSIITPCQASCSCIFWPKHHVLELPDVVLTGSFERRERPWRRQDMDSSQICLRLLAVLRMKPRV